MSDIKQYCLTSAVGHEGSQIPKKDLQDAAIDLALMRLIEAKLISISVEGRYVLNVVSLDENDRINELRIVYMRAEAMRQMGNRILELLRTDSGKYALEELYIALKLGDADLKFLDVNGLIQGMSSQGLVTFDKAKKIWLRSQVQ
jgi:hypothetical protein